MIRRIITGRGVQDEGSQMGEGADMPNRMNLAGADVEASGAPLLLLDSGRIREASSSACSMMGYSKEEILEQPMSTVFPALSAWDLHRAVEGLPENAELKIRAELGRKDGSRRPVRLRCSLGRRKSQLLIRMRHDRRAEDLLREEAGWGVLSTCMGLVLVLGDDDRIALASRAFRELLGVGTHELRGTRPWGFFRSSAEAEEARVRLAGLRKVRSPGRALWSWRTQGGVRHIDWQISFYPEPGDAQTYIILAGNDLTPTLQERDLYRNEREEARLALGRVRGLLGAIPALLSYVDRERRIVFASHHSEPWLGMPSSRVEGKRLEDVVSSDLALVIAPRLSRALAGEKQSFEVEIATPEGASRWQQATYLPEVDEQGAVQGVYVLVFDVTEHRRLINALL